MRAQFPQYLSRYEADGLEGLIDRRLEQVSNRRAPVDEVMALTERYRSRHSGWNVKHFHGWYKRDGSTRSYTWVKTRLQEARLVPKAEKRGVHRKRRERSALPGMMIHQDGSTHEWVAGQKWDLIVTKDDAPSEHYSMFFVEEVDLRSIKAVMGIDILRAKSPAMIEKEIAVHLLAYNLVRGLMARSGGGRCDCANAEL